jgi:sigma-B regulation protein RsbU (phosphoserine phosphatase)
MSMVIGRLDPQKKTLTYANAGQTPPLLLRKAGGASSLPTGEAALGIESGIAYKAAPPVTLARGDVLVWYTDGIVEARDAAGEQFGLERIEALLRANASATSRQLIDLLRAAVAKFVGADRFEDDLTLVVLRVT